MRAAMGETAARPGVDGARHLAGQKLRLFIPRFERRLGQRAEQRFGIRMPRIVKNLVRIAHFNAFAEVGDHDVFADVLND